MKYVVIVPDGMADLPLEELGNKTPLEVARTPHMDFLAQNGFTGMVKTIPDKMKPGSDVGNLSVMGYNPENCYLGRAPLEAANLGINLKEDEIAFRCNLVTILDDKMLDYSAGHISSEESGILVGSLNDELSEETIRFIPGKSYRHLVILSVRNVQDYLKIKCTPPHDIMGQMIGQYLPAGVGSKVLLRLMERSKAVLDEHPVNKVRIDLKENPANFIWLWGQGKRMTLPSFKEKYGIEGGVISAVDLVNGIGRLAGLEVIKVPGITGYYDTNYIGKANYALQALQTKDFVFVHIEGPDEAGHNGDAKAKISCIENIDREIIGTIRNHFEKNDDFRILIMPDHPTPISMRTHTSDPVPFVMYGKDIPNNGSRQFGESIVSEKGLKFASGEDLLTEFMRKSK
jgi:2,3-bisphosphoglycerate-independent phosphoglycerate mutase